MKSRSIPSWATSRGLPSTTSQAMELFAALLKELDAIQEGDGTLLDHSVVMAFTDQAYARIHSVDGLPILVAGGASGRMKTGITSPETTARCRVSA